MEKTSFFLVNLRNYPENWTEPKDAHIVGSLECTGGICGNKDGFYANIAPLMCHCGGIIHANGALNFDDEFGPYDASQCDSCKMEFNLDDIIRIKKSV